jgi:PAS domain S-box-containing protein
MPFHNEKMRKKPVEHPAGCWNFFSTLHQSLRVQEVLNAAAENIMNVFYFSGVDVHLLDPDSKELQLAARFGLSPDFIREASFPVEAGPAGLVLKTGKSLFLQKYPESPRKNATFSETDGPVAYACAAVSDKGKPLGVLSCFANTPMDLPADDRALFTGVASQLGLALANARTFEQAERKAHRFIAISRVISATRNLGTLEGMLQDVAKVMVQALGFDQAWIGLIHNRDNVLRGKAGFGAGMTAKSVSVSFPVELPTRNPALASALEQKPAVRQSLDETADEAFRFWMKRLRAQSYAFVPILSGEETFGVLGVFFIGDQVFQEEDIRTLTSVSEQTASAVENAQLYEKVKTSEERYRTLFESSGTSLAILDERNEFRLVNRAFEALSGCAREELIGKVSFFQFLGGKTQLPLLLDDDGISLKRREFLFRDRQGNHKHVHILADRIPDSADLLVSIIDMTRERELEKQLFKTAELASIGELSAGIAHEIRNPLVAITTSVSLLKDEKDFSSEGRQVLDVIREEADHLAAIVNDFLQFAKPKKPVLQPEDLNRLLRDVVKRHKETGRTDVEWIEEYDGRLPEISIDRHQVQQVVTNLLLNSLDAMPDGGTITVRTSLDDGSNGPAARVTISDTGMGIPEEDFGRIFQPFYSTKEKGTGMGLSICRRIISGHDGEISVSSKLLKGSAFQVTLPLKTKDPSTDER